MTRSGTEQDQGKDKIKGNDKIRDRRSKNVLVHVRVQYKL